MNKAYRTLAVLLGIVLFTATSCFDDLNVVPVDEDYNTSEAVYRDPASYRQVLAKLYAGLAVTGQQGPAGQGDIVGIDEGFSSYLRNLWNMQELPTEEAICAWNDQGIPELNRTFFDSNNPLIAGMYARIYFQIPLTNEYIRETTDEKLDFREIPADIQADVRIFRAEARFLRALSYWHGLDMFRNIPFIEEARGVGAYFPEQATPQEIFTYIESELKAIESILVAPGQNEYGRADQAAAWMLLAKLYLNAEVYIGESRVDESLEYIKKVIDSGAFSLEPKYEHLFMADNHNSNEIIFPVTFDGINTRTWGGMTFLINSSNGGSMVPADRGVNGAWGGNRVTSGLVMKFDTSAANTDERAMFYTDGQSLAINNPRNFVEGWAITKYSNIDQAGNPGSDNTHPDTDFPMFRLADAYLMYAEAVLRGAAGGDQATALGYINALRQRANANSITAGDMTLDFILDERARELYWECHRRTDLIRFGKFTTGDYVWPHKGNDAQNNYPEGRAIDEKFRIMPIPSSDLAANPTLVQNPNY